MGFLRIMQRHRLDLSSTRSWTQVVNLAMELVKWYQARENSSRYSIDPDIAATFANGAGSNDGDGDMDGESSDGEMDV